MRISTILFICICAISINAQNQRDSSHVLDKIEFKVGYYGNVIWNNGFNLGAEYVWKDKKTTRTKKKGPKTITHQLLLNASLGLSKNFTNQTESSFQTYYGVIWRRTSSKRWQLHAAFNPLGYYRSLLPETFEVKDGEVSTVAFPGRNYYTPSLGIGIGKLRKEKRVSGWYLNLNFAIRTPYNGGMLPMISLQYGYRFNVKKKK